MGLLTGQMIAIYRVMDLLTGQHLDYTMFVYDLMSHCDQNRNWHIICKTPKNAR